VAVFQNNTWTSGGMLTFPDGRRFKATTNLWMTHYEFLTESDEPFIKFKYGGAFRLSAQVEIMPRAREMAELPIPVLFGWYVAVMCYMDASAAASGAAAT
jgi:hypothetical protein